MDICGGTSTHGRSYKRFGPDLLRRYTTVAWFKYNLSFSGMDQKYGPYPLEIYGSGLWIARGWSVWIGALHAEPLPFTPGPGWAPSHHHEWIWITLVPRPFYNIAEHWKVDTGHWLCVWSRENGMTTWGDGTYLLSQGRASSHGF